MMKKTALDDQAQIYHHRDDLSDREKLGHMNKRQRMQYFRDYYLLKTIVIAAVVCAALFLIWYFVRGKKETILYVAVADHTFDAEKVRQMTGDLEAILDADGNRKEIIIDDSFYSDSAAAAKLQVYLFAGQLDGIIAEKDQWKEMASDGWLVPLDQVEGLSGSLAGSLLLESAGPAQETGQTASETAAGTDETEDSAGEVRAYGIDLSGCRLLTQGEDAMTQPVFAFANNSKHQENAVQFLKYLLADP